MVKVKSCLAIAAFLFCALVFATPAFAWTHGQFTATTDACAGCHVAHAAQGSKLLKAGPTQTQFCFLCHGDSAISAPYDVKNGLTSVSGVAYPSTGGGFVQQYNGSTETAVTSRHNVWGLVGESGSVVDEAYKVFVVPGGTNGLTGDGFVCSSCHDPHGGGATPDASGYVTGSATAPNPRLLRKSITVQDSAYTDLYVSFKVESVGTFTYQGVSSGVYRVTEYKSGSTKWCGACHNRFKNSIGDDNITGAGHATRYFDMWRHPMQVHAVLPTGSDGSVATGTPLETGTSGVGGTPDYVACLTCHRAHATTATMAGWALNWLRDGGGTGTTSALLRMDSRGVCYNCHGAGEYNCWNDTRVNCSSCHPAGHGGFDGSAACTFCHR